MKSIRILFFVLVSAIVLLCSCFQDKGNQATDAFGTYSLDDIPAGKTVRLNVDGTSNLTLSHANLDRCYIVSADNHRDLDVSRDSDSPLALTARNDLAVVPQQDGNTSFDSDDIGLYGPDTISVTYIVPQFDFCADYKEMKKIAEFEGAEKKQSGNSFSYQNVKIREYYYLRTTGEYIKDPDFDPSKVAIFQTQEDIGGNGYDYGFFKNGEVVLSSGNSNLYGLVDLDLGTDIEFGLYNTMNVTLRNDRTGAKLSLYYETPKVLSVGIPLELRKTGSNSGVSFVLEVPAVNDGKEYVIEYKMAKDVKLSDLEMVYESWGLGDSRYIGESNNGKRTDIKPAPIKYSGDTQVFYVGRLEEAFIFNAVFRNEYDSYGTFELRELVAADNFDSDANTITNNNYNTRTFSQTLTKENGVVSFILNETPLGSKNYSITASYEGSDIKLSARAIVTSGIGSTYKYQNGAITFNDFTRTSDSSYYWGNPTDTAVLYVYTNQNIGDREITITVNID